MEINAYKVKDKDVLQRSQYRIIRFVPDCMAGERINIGVVVRDCETGQLTARFITNRRRLVAFAPDNHRAATGFIATCARALTAADRGESCAIYAYQTIWAHRNETHDLFEFSDVEKSAQPAEPLLCRLAAHYLRE